MWNRLSMADRAKYIQLAVQNGITDLDSIRRAYTSYANGGYTKWKESISRYRDIDHGDTYDYEGYYNDDPEEAWRMLHPLEQNEEAHFTDKFKKPSHPTFSDESIYSTPETPGGHWHENYGGSGKWVYEPSEYTRQNKEKTIEYLRNSGEGYLDGMNATFYKRYDEGGDLERTHQEEILARSVYDIENGIIHSNYEDALDAGIGVMIKAPWTRFASRRNANSGWHIPAFGSNCTLNVSNWVDPEAPIMSARTITRNPGYAGYIEIPEKYAVPGDIVIADKNDEIFHTMLLSGFRDNETPLVNYSRGLDDPSALRQNIPLKYYIANSDGRDRVRYYRHLKEGDSEILLPELIVTPQGNYANEEDKIIYLTRPRRKTRK